MQKDSNIKTAVAYAEAWFQAAKNINNEDAVFNEVKALLTGIEDVLGLWDLLSSPIESEKDKLNILESLAKEAKLSAISIQALRLIAENNRLNLTPLILKEFIKLYYIDKGIIDVHVESAIKLTNEQDLRLKNVLEEKLEKTVIVSSIINPEILGGLKLSFNSYLFDDTVQTKLKQIEKLLTK